MKTYFNRVSLMPSLRILETEINKYKLFLGYLVDWSTLNCLRNSRRNRITILSAIKMQIMLSFKIK